ncbi:hypothetical protein [Pseudomonas protegens]|uniref:hypothetical protein n=1 Tax=Pseudomonas protegens TaxID=380021 RepID=UPI000C9C6F91|nr:hypothetical protein [Pseudomonas protegens]PNG32698.1 hypothetical protein A1348_13550 [Pseudomonas protegens]
MPLLSYRFHGVLIAMVSLITVLTIVLADAYAAALIDPLWGIRPGFFDHDVLKHLRMQDLMNPFIALYFYPVISVLIAYRRAVTRLIFIALSLLPMGLELYALGGGGDRKGCELCGLSVFYYGLAFPVLYPLIMGIALGIFFRPRRQPPDPKRKLDKLLAATAELFSLFMFRVLWRYIGW